MLGVSLVVQSLLGADGDRQNSSPAHHDLHQHSPSSQSMNETRFVRQTVTVCSDQDKSFETRSRVTEESHTKRHILFCSTHELSRRSEITDAESSLGLLELRRAGQCVERAGNG